jgi:hypothetical protein
MPEATSTTITTSREHFMSITFTILRRRALALLALLPTLAILPLAAHAQKAPTPCASAIKNHRR